VGIRAAGWRSVMIGVLLACGGAMVTGQQPTFRADRLLVPVFATVTDDDNRLVADLTQEDFEVWDDGKPQPLAFFENTVQPITVVVLLDTSGSMTLVLDRLRVAAEQFVIRLLPHDRARLCVFNDTIRFSEAFTADRDALARDVRDIDYGNGTRLYDGLAASLDALKGKDGRKVILLFTDGEDTGSRTRRRTIANRARAENVMLYAIGLETRYFDGDEVVHNIPDRRLKTLVAETGGGYFELTRSRDLEATFRRVGQELHSQYVLAISPTAFDGRVHKLEVHVNNATLNVRARHSYLAPPDVKRHSR
jgi:Ca-activated chloride channel family protein